MVMSGGAVATACREIGERVKHIAAHLLDASRRRAAAARRRSPRRAAPTSAMTLAEVAHIWYRQPQLLPPGRRSGRARSDRRLQGEGRYRHVQLRVPCGRASRSTPRPGQVEILDYVDRRGRRNARSTRWSSTARSTAAPRRASARRSTRRCRTTREGQPLASTLADYLLPGATEVPALRIVHMETPSPYTEFGQKGIGEGGAIAPPAAIVNAVNDALARPRRRDHRDAGHAAQQSLAAIAAAAAMTAGKSRT